MRAKTLAHIRRDMSELYELLKHEEVDQRLASELANITGKHLKAIALQHARAEFLSVRPKRERADS